MNKIDLIGDRNVGYTVLCQREIVPNEWYEVIAYNSAKNDYVIWSYMVGQGYWAGRYYPNFKMAYKDFK